MPSEGGIKDSEGATDGIYILFSEGDTSSVYYYLSDGPLRDAPETTTLLTSEKFKEDTTTEILRIKYKDGHTTLNSLQDMARNGLLTKCLADFPIPVCTYCL